MRYNTCFGTYNTCFGTYNTYSGTYNTYYGTYNTYFGTYNTCSGTYNTYSGTYNTYSGTYLYSAHNHHGNLLKLLATMTRLRPILFRSPTRETTLTKTNGIFYVLLR